MLSVFKKMKTRDHEQVIFCHDNNSNLKAIIAIHNTAMGPAFGGCRMWNYNSEEDALEDVLRLSRGMSYKAAVAGISLGGGKAVIIGDSRRGKNEKLFRAFGRFVEGLAGRYITAEDVGTSVKDMEWVRMETSYVTGISPTLGGSGDPSPLTALGIYSGIKATVKKQLGKDSLTGLNIGIQGVGHVGYYLCRYLKKNGANLYVSDINKSALKRVVEEFQAKVLDIDEIFRSDIDIFSPCALGATLNSNTIPQLKCSIVAGAANNQLKKEDIHSQMLHDRGILYAPDFVINAGGLINCANEIEGYNHERAFQDAKEGIYNNLIKVYNLSEKDSLTTQQAALKIAKKRMFDITKLKNGSLKMENIMGKRDNG